MTTTRFPLTRYELVTSVDFKKCESKAATCAKLVCPKSKISQLAALIGQDASEKVFNCFTIIFSITKKIYFYLISLLRKLLFCCKL